jgi:hypothetical protein
MLLQGLVSQATGPDIPLDIRPPAERNVDIVRIRPADFFARMLAYEVSPATSSLQ